MPRKQPDVFYIYKTTCTITGRWYIGMHATANINDDYLGSGKRLRYSIRKYGKENHVREILEYLPSKEKMIEREKEMITANILCDDQCMNLMSGGTGGFISVEQQRHRSTSANQKLQEKLKDPQFHANWKTKMIAGLKEAYADGRKAKNWGDKRKNTNCSEEHKRKIGLANSIKQKGELNSQYGTIWIKRNQEVKKIKKELLADYLSVGWERGKKLL